MHKDDNDGAKSWKAIMYVLTVKSINNCEIFYYWFTEIHLRSPTKFEDYWVLFDIPLKYESLLAVSVDNNLQQTYTNTYEVLSLLKLVGLNICTEILIQHSSTFAL